MTWIQIQGVARPHQEAYIDPQVQQTGLETAERELYNTGKSSSEGAVPSGVIFWPRRLQPSRRDFSYNTGPRKINFDKIIYKNVLTNPKTHTIIKKNERGNNNET